MFLITSGAYISEDFMSEIGKLPPAFLPIGNKRLYRYQIEAVRKSSDDIYLSIPEDYSIPEADAEFFRSNNINIIPVPPGLNLGQSIIYCWNATGKRFDTLRILHGDSLFMGIDYSAFDQISIDKNKGFYKRAVLKDGVANKITFCDEWVGNDKDVVSGYFSFSEPQIFFKGVIENRNNFVAGLSYYSETVGLEPIRAHEWFDFGHINSFFRSRSSMTTQRVFNDMEITSRFVVKSSRQKINIQAEANWFESLPVDLKYYTPRLMSRESSVDSVTYKLEYLYLLPLSDLFVYGNLRGAAWYAILSSCKAVYDEFRKYAPETSLNPEQLNDIYLPKTLQRLTLFFEQSQADLPDFMDREKLFFMAEKAAEFIHPVAREHIGIAHGDFCFSNILYDNRLQKVKMIDPRGRDSANNLTIYGDCRYDLAKLYHSVIGLYDLILAECYTLDQGGQIKFFLSKEQKRVQGIFRQIFFADNPGLEQEILAINVLLFLSMVPLHSDRPAAQQAMVANALRLYRELQEY